MEDCKASSRETKEVVRKEKEQGSILGWIRHDPPKSLTNLLIPSTDDVGVVSKQIWPGNQVDGGISKVLHEQAALPGPGNLKEGAGATR